MGNLPDDGVTELTGMAVPRGKVERRDLRRRPTKDLLDVLQEPALLPCPPARRLRVNEQFHGRIGRFGFAPRSGAVAEVSSLVGLKIAQADLHDRHLSLLLLPRPRDHGFGSHKGRFVDPQSNLFIPHQEARLAVAGFLDAFQAALLQRSADRAVAQ